MVAQTHAANQTQLDELCIHTIRTLSMDAVQQANSGHPGTPMALAPVAYCLWQRFLRFDPDVLLLATGSEVLLCIEAYEQLKTEGIKARVVSMPSWELFEQQSQDYRDSVIPPAVTARVCVEQASTFGWGEYVGSRGGRIVMHTFGASAPLKELQRKFGFTPDKVVAAAKAQVADQH